MTELNDLIQTLLLLLIVIILNNIDANICKVWKEKEGGE
jgi:hypothetical protein